MPLYEKGKKQARIGHHLVSPYGTSIGEHPPNEAEVKTGRTGAEKGGGKVKKDTDVGDGRSD